ncbi:MAG: tail fiber domain-containing protein [Candidatus Nomurabacteria bacterium]|nr:tail fiber domain-containing protein [Candidatus Nomurabacteria bacterium]
MAVSGALSSGNLTAAGSTIILGAGDGGTPTATTIRGAAASGVSVAGANMTFDASNGTGVAGSGAFVWRTAPANALETAGAVGFLSASVGRTAWGTSLTFAHTITSGANRALIVAILNNLNISSITYNGQNMSLYYNSGGDWQWAYYYLLESQLPTDGNPHNIVITVPSNIGIEANAHSFNNVNQTTPIRSRNTYSSNANATSSVTITSASGDMVMSNIEFDAITGAGVGQTTHTGISNIWSSTKPSTSNSETNTWSNSSPTWLRQSDVSIQQVAGVQLNISTNTLTERLRLDQNGNFGIGNSAPAVLLHVGSSATTDGATLLRLQDSNSTCNFTADAGAPTCGSDRSIKKDIITLDNADILSKLTKLDAVSYHWLTDDENSPIQYGFIAQNVQEQFPNLVKEGTWIDGSQKLFLSMGGLMPYTVSAIKELNLNLEGISGTITPLAGSPNESFVTAFFNNVYKKVGTWMGDATNGIGNMFANVFNAKEKICVDGECLTKDDVHALLLLAHPGGITTPPAGTPPPQGGEASITPTLIKEGAGGGNSEPNPTSTPPSTAGTPQEGNNTESAPVVSTPEPTPTLAPVEPAPVPAPDVTPAPTESVP